jgi:DNA gyrase subunit A
VKKTPLDAYSRPKKGGIIAIKLKEDDELVDVVVVGPDDQLLMATAGGKAIRFAESDARSMGRNTSGVKGIRLKKGDRVVGMVIANPEETLLTVCEQGYGKRTWFGAGQKLAPPESSEGENGDENTNEVVDVSESPEAESDDGNDDLTSTQSYRTQRRGGGGLMDIKTSKRNGPVIGIVPVTDEDELLMMTSRGKIQRVAAREINIIGRNTQGVRIMNVDEGDALTAIVKVPKEDEVDEEAASQGLDSPSAPSEPKDATTSTPPESDATPADSDETASPESDNDASEDE